MARKIEGGLELSWHKATKRWYRSITVNGKSKPIYFGSGKNKVTYRHNWGEHRVYFHDEAGRLIALPASWTSVCAENPFVAVSSGRSAFRVQDLLELADLLDRLRKGGVT